MNTQPPSRISLPLFLPGRSTVTSLDKTIRTYRTNSAERRKKNNVYALPRPILRSKSRPVLFFLLLSIHLSLPRGFGGPPLRPCQDAKDSNQALSWMAISRDKGHGEEQDWRGGGKRGGTKTALGTQGSNQPLTSPCMSACMCERDRGRA